MFDAVREGNIESLRLSLGPGDVNAKDENGFSLLHIACICGKLNIVQFLVNEGCHLEIQDKGGSTPLHKASVNGHTDIVCTLLSHGAQVNARDDNGLTALHHACIYGHHATAAQLLENGALVDIQDNHGQTALHYASMKGIVEILVLLLEQNAQINLQDHSDLVSPLHHACQFGHIAVVNELLDRGAAVNLQDKKGDSPLHYCCQSGHSDILTLLLHRKADFCVKNKRGKTPLDYARQHNASTCVSLLNRAHKEKDLKDHQEIQNRELLSQELQFLRTENEFLRKELRIMKEKTEFREKEMINELKKRNQEVNSLKSQLSKILIPETERNKTYCDDVCLLTIRLTEIERKCEQLLAINEAKEMALNEKETQLLEYRTAIKELKTQLESKDLMIAHDAGLDTPLHRDLQELKMMILMSSRRNASAPIIHEHVKLFDHLTGRDISKTTCVESMLVGNHLSDELNCKVKEFIVQLENRERELFSKNELDQAKFCQLSRKYFINFVELIGGGGGIPVGNRKDPPLSSVQANTTIVLLDTSASSTESTILKNG